MTDTNEPETITNKLSNLNLSHDERQLMLEHLLPNLDDWGALFALLTRVSGTTRTNMIEVLCSTFSSTRALRIRVLLSLPDDKFVEVLNALGSLYTDHLQEERNLRTKHFEEAHELINKMIAQ